MLEESDAGSYFVETAMLPFHLAVNTAVVVQSVFAAAWSVPRRLSGQQPEQLVVPTPIEDDSERCLFA